MHAAENLVDGAFIGWVFFQFYQAAADICQILLGFGKK
jgi:hypothetical protein